MMLEDVSEMTQQIYENQNKLNEKLTPKKKVRARAQALREPIPHKMLLDILEAERPHGVHTLTWARFKLTCTIFYFSGIRINEVARITVEMVEAIILESKFCFYQPKVNTYRFIRFNETGVSMIKGVYEQTKAVVFKDDNELFPLSPSQRQNMEKFIGITNKYLRIFAEPYNINVSSHSFRINFVTKSLKHTDPHNAQKLIGHSDIRSTMKYNRYNMDPEKEAEILDNMFSDDI